MPASLKKYKTFKGLKSASKKKDTKAVDQTLLIFEEFHSFFKKLRAARNTAKKSSPLSYRA